MKVRITRGTAQYKRKEYTETDGIVDFPEDVVRSLQNSQTTDVEVVSEIQESNTVGTPGSISLPPSDDGPAEGTVKWYRQELDALGVEYPSEALKAELVTLYEKATDKE
jgi:hypothetical protein